MTQTNGLRAALAACKPGIAQSFVALVTRIHARMVADLGPALRGVGNSYAHAKSYRCVVSPFIVAAGGDNSLSITRDDADRVLDIDRLQAVAKQHAEAVVAAWEVKITKKMGEVDGATVTQVDDVTFTVLGTKGDRAVRIEQRMIMNVSSAGRFFHQFPARIYVNGRFTSEAAYQRLAAQVSGARPSPGFPGPAPAPAQPASQPLRRGA